MRQTRTKFLSVLLTLVMVLGMLSTTALAATYISTIEGYINLNTPFFGKKVSDYEPTLRLDTSGLIITKCWWEQKWGDTWEKMSGDDGLINTGAVSNKFTEGTWRYRIELRAENGHKFYDSDSINVTINSKSWDNKCYSTANYCELYSPEFVVSKEYITAPLAGTATLPEARCGVTITPVLDGYINELNQQGKLSFQWMRKASGGSNFMEIPGATGSSYTPTDSDMGATIYVSVWASQIDRAILSNKVQVKVSVGHTLNSVQASVTVPTVGASKEDCVPRLTTANMTIDHYNWYYTGSGEQTNLRREDFTTFEDDCNYLCQIYVRPDSTYAFADDATGMVNGKTAETQNGTDLVRLSYEVTVKTETKMISAVTITGLDALKHGQAADYTASTSTPGCTVKKIEYQMFRKTMTDYVPIDGDNVAVVVTVSAADGYEFASGSTATWNGLKSDDTVAGLNAKEKRYAFYIEVKADASQIVKSAAMTVTAPEIGKAPSTAVTGTGVEASSVKWSPADATFQAGTAYTVSFTLKADAAHVLADDFKNAGTVTVNGQKAVLTSTVKGKFVTYTVSYTFPALKAGEITSVAITGLDTPAVGAQPDTAVEADSEKYTVTSVLWSPGDSKFAADKAYTVNLTLKAAGTNKFTSKVTASVNGQEAKIVSGTGTQELRINYTFPALKAGAPAITAQPKSVTVKPGADVTFSVAATGEALNYQWWRETKSGASKVGTNGPTYTIKAVNVSDDNGTAYYCVVSNKAGEVTSDKAKLTVSELGAMTAFSDVPEGAYYTDAVAWAVEKGVTSGTSSTTFSPNTDCTRAQIVTFLWRAAGNPAPKSKESSFADVAADAYYSDAVRWAVENGITSGTSATTFSPNATCTRAQTVTFLWRSQKSPADGAANSFADVAEGTYYTNAVKWAVKNGITSGTGANTFSPNADCSRAQIVTFLHRCMGK